MSAKSYILSLRVWALFMSIVAILDLAWAGSYFARGQWVLGLAWSLATVFVALCLTSNQKTIREIKLRVKNKEVFVLGLFNNKDDKLNFVVGRVHKYHPEDDSFDLSIIQKFPTLEKALKFARKAKPRLTQLGFIVKEPAWLREQSKPTMAEISV